MSISHIFEPVSRQKINLGRKPPATSASGKPVKCTFGCHSQFGISNFSFYILERSITTEMNQYSGDADLLALQILCLFIASGFYRKLLSIFFIFSALGKKKKMFITVCPDSSGPFTKEFFEYGCSFTVGCVPQGEDDITECWDLQVKKFND